MSAESMTQAFPWNWWTAFLPAPQNLTQPILPGWTIGPVVTINNDNSSGPQTEVEIVQRHSYGRQLGRIIDALEALIRERDPDAAGDERFKAFLAMKKEIDTVKLDTAVSRVEQLRRDLASLKATRPAGYEGLREAVRRVVDE
jgi:hypothetical protein